MSLNSCVESECIKASHGFVDLEEGGRAMRVDCFPLFSIHPAGETSREESTILVMSFMRGS